MGDFWQRQREQAREIRQAYMSNWNEFEGSTARKLALTAKNRTKAFVTLKGCCGNHGQPGC